MTAIDPARCAVLLQGYQNDLLHPDGALWNAALAAHAKAQDLLGNTGRILAAARSAGANVVHALFVVDAPLPDTAPLFRQISARGGVRRGSWGAAPVEAMPVAPGDIVVEKRRESPFFGTGLDDLLRGRGVETIVLCGATTTMGIEHAARFGADAGYRMVVVADATAAAGDAAHQASLSHGLSAVSTVLWSDDVIRAVKGEQS